MKNFLVIIGLIVFPIIVSAQTENAEGLIFEDEWRKSFNSKPKLDVKFDNRFSFIRNNDVQTIGLKVGLNYRRKFKIGLGINRMLFPVDTYTFDDNDIKVPVTLEYYYFSPYIEYVYYTDRKWEFSLSLQAGIGEASYQFTNVDGGRRKLGESNILSYEPAMLIDYKIVKWVAVGTGVGYRMILYKRPIIKEQFSSPEYVVKLKIYLGEIYRTLTGKKLEID